jgi:hypothetical protein
MMKTNKPARKIAGDVPPGLVAGAFRESRHPRQPGDTRNWGCIKARGEDLSERLSNDH